MNFKVNLDICRVCMKPEDGASLLNDNDLRHMFEFTTRLSVNDTDSMPATVCAKCITRLKIAFYFVELAHASDTNLKTFLKKIKNDFQNVTKTSPYNNVVPQEYDDLLVLVLDDAASSATIQKKEQEIQQQLPSPPQQKQMASQQRKQSALSQKQSKSINEAQQQPNSVTKSRLLTEKEQEPAVVGVIKHEEAIQEEEEAEEEEEDEQEKLVEEEADEEFQDVEQEGSYMIFEDLTETKDKTHMEIGEEINNSVLTDDEEQDYEILEDQSEDNSQSQIQQHVNNDGYLKEYEAMLEENEAANCTEFDASVSTADDDNTTDELNAYSEDLMPTQIEILDEMDDVPKLDDDNSNDMQLVATTSAAATAPEADTVVAKTNKTKTARKSNRTNRKSPIVPVHASMNTRFICVKCNRDFSTRTNLTRHMATHAGSRPYSCNICGKGFTQNGSLKQHMYTHTGEKPYVCEICNRGFTQCKSLVFHMRRHTGEKPFPCQECGSWFRQKDGLKSHLLKHHMKSEQDGDMQTHICVICKKFLNSKYLLQVHMKKHVNNHKNVGPNSSSATTNSSTDQSNEMLLLLEEEETPIDDNEFLGYDFPTSVLDVSSATHVVDIMATSASEPSRAKKYQCRKCFKCFAIKNNLIRHLSIHDTNLSKMFQCKICEIAFDNNNALKVHRIRAHKDLNINLNECDECLVVFRDSNALNEHVSIAHDLNCPDCKDLSFNTQKQLMEHMMEHDLNETNENE